MERKEQKLIVFLLIYSHTISPRLLYMAGLLSHEWKQHINLTQDLQEFNTYKNSKINYTEERISQEEIWIKPSGLLFENNIIPQMIEVMRHEGEEQFFQNESDFGFDLLAAAFYLVSRYEEYLPHSKDEYGRFDHRGSLAFKNGFLNKPLVNSWFEKLRERLGFTSALKFQFIPTYDIDEAWSYKHKQLWRSFGGAARDLLRGSFRRFRERSKVLKGKQLDPYDSYTWLDELHLSHPEMKPIYFFQVAARNGRFDKNILPEKEAMRDLIRRHASQYEIGLHPSWQSGDEETFLKKEKNMLEEISGKRIVRSRQHYIRMNLPDTYRKLIDAGISEDYSMGYGSINGLRASIASPYYWYDLKKEETTNLILYPFCFMDANSLFEQRQSPEEALKDMEGYRKRIRSINGTMISIWHNTFLGTDELFKGWKEAYQHYLTS